MLIWLNLLLLSFVNYSGTSTLSVTGEKGGSVILPCEFEANKISAISLNSRSENIPVCQTEECSGRVFKEGNCDVVIKNLSFSDAGKYFLHLYYNNDQKELERQIRTYQLHIHDEICVNIGEQLKLDVLLSEADKVQHQSRRSTEWKEVWRRKDRVWGDRLTHSDGNMTILQFVEREAGTYRVLDSEGNTLITVTITESRTESKRKLEKTEDTKRVPVMYCIMSAGLLVYEVLLVLTLVTFTIKKQSSF